MAWRGLATTFRRYGNSGSLSRLLHDGEQPLPLLRILDAPVGVQKRLAVRIQVGARCVIGACQATRQTDPLTP